MVVLSYFLGGWDTPNPPKIKVSSPLKKLNKKLMAAIEILNFFFNCFFALPLRGKPLEARGETASIDILKYTLYDDNPNYLSVTNK